ncbi:MAG: TOBE domain-containing protein, partial [Acidimicrobiales bacterium]
ALDGGPHPDGVALTVLVRPEQIVLTRWASEEVGEVGTGGLTGGVDGDLASGRVVEAEYYGHDAVVRICPSWDPEAIVVVRLSDAGCLPEDGSQVGVSARGCTVGWVASTG